MEQVECNRTEMPIGDFSLFKSFDKCNTKILFFMAVFLCPLDDNATKGEEKEQPENQNGLPAPVSPVGSPVGQLDSL